MIMVTLLSANFLSISFSLGFEWNKSDIFIFSNICFQNKVILLVLLSHLHFVLPYNLQMEWGLYWHPPLLSYTLYCTSIACVVCIVVAISIVQNNKTETSLIQIHSALSFHLLHPLWLWQNEHLFFLILICCCRCCFCCCLKCMWKSEWGQKLCMLWLNKNYSLFLTNKK